MKKFLTIAMAFLYLLVSSGFMVEIHHCMGRVADTGIRLFHIGDDDTHCGKCGMDKSGSGKHCCKDEYKSLQVKDDQKPASLHFQLDAPVLVLNSKPFEAEPPTVLQDRCLYPFRPNPPPDLTDPPLSLLCVFRI
ncbi:HYC_CC_PP family protein [Flavihumibacter petaseus]|uniref:Uncharacterized protein n=1 Tax=Flavihumibacter petaseus NBRC 106054 TaxID=1220578 RepID=A0A0E9N0A2_9BACT|nr:hypothetical protein [Flavihumibacter petaseus]GAO43422.1 hypothetical protein FPE01S_02_05270 [Flavihumibacter petaseus NBRC 106054]